MLRTLANAAVMTTSDRQLPECAANACCRGTRHDGVIFDPQVPVVQRVEETALLSFGTNLVGDLGLRVALHLGREREDVVGADALGAAAGTPCR